MISRIGGFLRLVGPLLMVEFLIVALKWMFLSEASPIDLPFAAASYGVLPFVAGWRLRVAKASLWSCALSGMAFVLVDLAYAAAVVVFGFNTWLAFLGFVVASAFFTVGPSILFAFLGAVYGKYLFRTAA